MNRDDIIRMAREAGMERVVKVHPDGTRTIELPHPALLERFAALIEQHLIQQGYRQCAKNQRTTQHCGLLEEAVRQERQRLHDKFLHMHEQSKRSHNYWHFAANVIVEEPLCF